MQNNYSQTEMKYQVDQNQKTRLREIDQRNFLLFQKYFLKQHPELKKLEFTPPRPISKSRLDLSCKNQSKPCSQSLNNKKTSFSSKREFIQLFIYLQRVDPMKNRAGPSLPNNEMRSELPYFEKNGTEFNMI